VGSGLDPCDYITQDYSQKFKNGISYSGYRSGILTETKREDEDSVQPNRGKGTDAQQPKKTKPKSEEKNQARKSTGQCHRSEDNVKLVVGQIFAGGLLPACVRETVNITKDEFEQKFYHLI
jgi:hypothetical protein